jgi:hypothetical protein
LRLLDGCSQIRQCCLVPALLLLLLLLLLVPLLLLRSSGVSPTQTPPRLV